MTIRLQVRELAEAKGLNISSFQREAKIPMTTARRFWYSSSNGKENGPPLKFINLQLLEYLCEFFGVDPDRLFKFV